MLKMGMGFVPQPIPFLSAFPASLGYLFVTFPLRMGIILLTALCLPIPEVLHWLQSREIP